MREGDPYSRAAPLDRPLWRDAFKRVGVKVTGVSSVRSLSALGACYHRSCDDLTDVDQNSMVLGSNAIAAAVWSLAGTATS